MPTGLDPLFQPEMLFPPRDPSAPPMPQGLPPQAAMEEEIEEPPAATAAPEEIPPEEPSLQESEPAEEEMVWYDDPWYGTVQIPKSVAQLNDQYFKQMGTFSEKEGEEGGIEFSDLGAMVMSGGASVAQGAGWAAEKLGMEDVGGFIEEYGANAVDYWNEKLSDGAKAELAKEFIKVGEDGKYSFGDAGWRKVALLGAGSLLGTAAGAGVGAGITKVLQVFGNPKGRAALQAAIKAGEGSAAGTSAAIEAAAAAKKLKVINSVLGAAGFGAGEGLVAAGMSGSSVQEEAMQLPQEILEKSQRFQSARAAAEATGMSRDEANLYAREREAEAAASSVAAKTFITTALLSSPTGAFFGKLMGERAMDAIQMAAPSRIAIGAGGEALQEAAQSGSEKYIKNEELMALDDRIQDPMEGVLDEAVGGFLAGGAIGGIMAAPGGPGKEKADVEQKGDESGIDPVLKKRPVEYSAARAKNRGVDEASIAEIVGSAQSPVLKIRALDALVSRETSPVNASTPAEERSLGDTEPVDDTLNVDLVGEADVERVNREDAEDELRSIDGYDISFDEFSARVAAAESSGALEEVVSLQEEYPVYGRRYEDGAGESAEAETVAGPESVREAQKNLATALKKYGADTKRPEQQDEILRLRQAVSDARDASPRAASTPSRADTRRASTPEARLKTAEADLQEAVGTYGEEPGTDKTAARVASARERLLKAQDAVRIERKLKVEGESQKDRQARIERAKAAADKAANQLETMQANTGLTGAPQTDAPSTPAEPQSPADAAIEAAAAETEPNPTAAQIKSGNYRKGRATVYGLGIEIENRAGSVRRGKAPDGRKWAVQMPAHYGYFRDQDGNDGEGLDVMVGAYVGGAKKAEKVYVLDQTDEDGNFDEHKVLVGFTDQNQAEQTYLAAHEQGWDRYSGITEMSPREFKLWLKNGDKAAPVQELLYSRKKKVLDAPAGGGMSRSEAAFDFRRREEEAAKAKQDKAAVAAAERARRSGLTKEQRAVEDEQKAAQKRQEFAQKKREAEKVERARRDADADVALAKKIAQRSRIPEEVMQRGIEKGQKGERITKGPDGVEVKEPVVIPASMVATAIARDRAESPVRKGWEDLTEIDSVSIDKKNNVTIKWKESGWNFAHDPETGAMANNKATRERAEKRKVQMANRLVMEVRNVQKRAETGDERARTIMRQAHWYSNMTYYLRQVFGAASDLVADILGATSPQTPVRENFLNTIDILKQIARKDMSGPVKAFKDHLSAGGSIAEFKKTNDAHLITHSVTGKKFGINSGSVLKAVAGLLRRGAVGDSAKATSFAANLAGLGEMATIDVWAARSLQRIWGDLYKKKNSRKPPRVQRGVKGTLTKEGDRSSASGEYRFGADVFDLASKKLEMDPHELQAVMWFIEKEIWTNNQWTTAAGEGGSFEKELSAAQFRRLVVGVSAATVGSPPKELVSETEKKLNAMAQKNGALFFRANPTYGRYGEDEESFDVEIIMDAGFNWASYTKGLARLSRQLDQDSFLVARALDVDEASHPNARPGIEIYIKQPKLEPGSGPVPGEMVAGAQVKAAVRNVWDSLQQYLDITGHEGDPKFSGFTYIVDPKTSYTDPITQENFIGMRVFYAPEIGGRMSAQDGKEGVYLDAMATPEGVEKDYAIAYKQLHDAVEYVSERDDVQQVLFSNWDVTVVFKESYNEVSQGTFEGIGSEARGSWEAVSRFDAFEKAVGRYRGRGQETRFAPEGAAGSTERALLFSRSLISRVIETAPEVPGEQWRTRVEARLSKAIAAVSGVRVKVVRTARDIPGKAPVDVEGAYDKATNTVYLVSSNLPSMQRAGEVFLHEVFGHAAMEQLVPEFDSVLSAVIIEIERNNPEYLTFVNRVIDSEGGRPSPRRLAKEVIAQIAETGVDMPIIKELVALVRQLLRRLGLKLRLTETDIRHLIARAARDFSGGQAARLPLTTAAELMQAWSPSLMEDGDLSEARIRAMMTDTEKDRWLARMPIEDINKVAGRNVLVPGEVFADPNPVHLWIENNRVVGIAGGGAIASAQRSAPVVFHSEKAPAGVIRGMGDGAVAAPAVMTQVTRQRLDELIAKYGPATGQDIFVAQSKDTTDFFNEIAESEYDYEAFTDAVPGAYISPRGELMVPRGSVPRAVAWLDSIRMSRTAPAAIAKGELQRKLEQEARDVEATATARPERVQVGRGARGETGILADPRWSDYVSRPLTGAPEAVEVDGRKLTYRPFAKAREAAARYVESTGRIYNPPTTYAKVDKARAKRIAQAFDEMKHDPQNPMVRAAYRAMINETLEQYRAILATGLHVEFIDYGKSGDPYGNPRNVIDDISGKNHMWVYSTRDGFGSSELDVSDNPLLAETEFIISGQRALANDIFRCFVPGTLVRTRQGFRKIEDICVGDEVLTHKGRYRKVLTTMSRPHEGEVVATSTNASHEPIVSTVDHKFFVMEGVHDQRKKSVCTPYICHRKNYVTGKHTKQDVHHQFVWKEIGNLDEGTWFPLVVDQCTEDMQSVRVPAEYVSGKAKGPKAYELTNDFLWFVGLYIAEGSSVPGANRIMFALHASETAYVERIKAFANSQGYGRSGSGGVKVRAVGNGLQVAVNNKTLCDWFPAWVGRGANNKTIPEELMRLPPEKLHHLIQGIMDGDGRKRCGSIIQTSEILALQLVEAGARLGFQPTTSKVWVDEDPKHHNAYTVHEVVSKNHSSRQKKYTWKILGSDCRQITRLERASYSGLVYDIEVEEDHSFVVQNVPVHNCVHDYFGHVKDGVGFRAEGEENAWRSHAAMYSPLARRAMTTETRGQNSWVNFGPFSEENKAASGAETHYADQKVGLLPEWVSEEGMRDDLLKSQLHFLPQKSDLGFYSNLERATYELNLKGWKDGKTLPVPVFIANLKKDQRVKPEELNWSGFEDYVRELKTISIEQAREYFLHRGFYLDERSSSGGDPDEGSITGYSEEVETYQPDIDYIKEQAKERFERDGVEKWIVDRAFSIWDDGEWESTLGMIESSPYSDERATYMRSLEEVIVIEEEQFYYENDDVNLEFSFFIGPNDQKIEGHYWAGELEVANTVIGTDVTREEIRPLLRAWAAQTQASSEDASTDDSNGKYQEYFSEDIEGQYRETRIRLPATIARGQRHDDHWRETNTIVSIISGTKQVRVPDESGKLGPYVPSYYLAEIQSDVHSNAEVELDYSDPKTTAKKKIRYTSAVDSLRKNRQRLSEIQKEVDAREDALRNQYGIDALEKAYQEALVQKNAAAKRLDDFVFGNYEEARRRRAAGESAEDLLAEGGPLSEIAEEKEKKAAQALNLLTNAELDVEIATRNMYVKERKDLNEAIRRDKQIVIQGDGSTSDGFDMPYKGKDYAVLGFKRGLTLAVSKGLGHISWSTAEARAERWSEEYLELYQNIYDKKLVSAAQKMGMTPRQWGNHWVAEIPVDIKEQIETYGLPYFSRQKKAAATTARPETADLLYSRRAKMSTQYESISDRVMDKSQEDLTIRDRWHRFRQRLRLWDKGSIKQGILDAGYAIERMERQLTGGELLDAMDSPYKAYTATKNLSSVMAAIFRLGVPEYKDGTFQSVAGRKGLEEIFNQLKDAKGNSLLRGWEVYAAARRASRLINETNPDGTAREKNFTQDEINTILREGDQVLDANGNKLFDKVFMEWQQFNDMVLDLAVSIGAMDPEMREKWRTNDYVPFYRAMGLVASDTFDGTDSSSDPIGGSAGIVGKKVLSERLHGSDKQIAGEVFENMVMNVAYVMDTIYKHNAMKRIVELGDGVVMTKVPLSWKAINFSGEQLARAMLAGGLINAPAWHPDPQAFAQEVVKSMTAAQKDQWVAMFKRTAPQGKNIVSVMENGKEAYYEILDPLLLRSISAIGHRNFEGLAWNIFRKPKQLLTTLITADPAFMLANFARDTLSAWVTSDAGFKPGWDSLKGVWAGLSEDPILFQIMMAGNGGGGYYAQGASDLRDLIALKAPKGGVDSFMKTIVHPKELWRIWQKIGSASENANRIAIARAVLEKGGSLAEASYQAQDVMNFSMRGDYAAMQALVEVLPFFNARVQGLYRLYRGARDNPAAFTAKGMILMGATLALLAKNWDDERYKELEEWDKDTYWHFFIDGEHYRLPKPFEVGAAFATVPERLVNTLMGDDSGKLFGSRMLAMFGDTFAMNPIPQVMRPMIEQYMNKEFFTGNPIIGLSLDGLPPEEQYEVYTSALMRELADGMPDWAPEWMRSPKRLESAYRGYLGTMGMYVLGVANELTREAANYPERPTLRMYDMPVASRFRRDPNPSTNKYSELLYNWSEQANEIARAIKNAKEMGSVDRARELKREHASKLRVRKEINAIRRDISAVNKKMRLIEYHPTMDADLKRERVEKLKAKRYQLLASAEQYAWAF